MQQNNNCGVSGISIEFFQAFYKMPEKNARHFTKCLKALNLIGKNSKKEF
jgi:hypothetical protein